MRNETSFCIDDAKISNLFMLFAQLLAAMQISFRSKTHFEKFSFEILKFIFFCFACCYVGGDVMLPCRK